MAHLWLALCSFAAVETVQTKLESIPYTVSKVLKYAWNHKYPERLSAFTYWEEDIPSCIDLGKDKYGGLFTTEEVEDVKTFLRLLLLLTSMFGIHVDRDCFSVARHMEVYSCPSQTILLLLVLNPLHLSSVVVVGIPLFCKYWPCRVQCTISVNMLRRIGVGMVILLAQEVFYTILTTYHEFSTKIVPKLQHFNKFLLYKELSTYAWPG